MLGTSAARTEYAHEEFRTPLPTSAHQYPLTRRLWPSAGDLCRRSLEGIHQSDRGTEPHLVVPQRLDGHPVVGQRLNRPAPPRFDAMDDKQAPGVGKLSSVALHPSDQFAPK